MPIIGIYERQNLSNRQNDDTELWLLYERDSTSELGLAKVDENFSIVQRFDFPGTLYGVRLMSLDRDKDGIFWIATWGIGMCRYDPRDSSYVNIRKIPGDPGALKSDFVMGIIVDRDQNVWAATNQGLSRLQKQSLSFYNTKKSGHILRLSTLFKAREKDYLLIDNAKAYGDHEIMAAPIAHGLLDSLVFRTVIKSFRGPQLNGFSRGKKKFWVSVSGVGVINTPINPQTEMIDDGPLTTLSHDPKNENTISSNGPTAVWEDADENLWVGVSNRGLNKISGKIPYGAIGSVEKYTHIPTDTNSIGNNEVKYIFPEDAKSFWVLTASGVDLFRDNRFAHFFRNKERATSFYKTKTGNVLIGTSAGLYEGIKTGTSYKFNKLKAFNNIHIVAINEDPTGRFWLSTLQGITCYDRTIDLTIEFNRNDGFENYRTSDPNCMPYITSDGIMVVPGYDGYSLFDPLSLKINQDTAVPVFTKLLINNKSQFISQNDYRKEQHSLDNDISILDKLSLNYKQNNFILEFSAMEFTSPEKNLYRHKLEGYDKDWIETDWKSRTATYTNLDPGKYTFKVKASNDHGIWSDHETTLPVVILPPPWQTWWAYILYLLGIASLVLYWRNHDIKRIKLRNRAQQLAELDQLKTRFFANISHEFRTPVTLILGPLKDLYKSATYDDQKALFAVMIRNGQRLLRLINQLLDLSKIEAGKMQLCVAKIEMVAFLREHASAYESIAASKNIHYYFEPRTEQLEIYADRDKIEKVIHNLLSNAMKFTTSGHVIMTLNQNENKWAEISVEDSGTGIPEDQLDKVFDRFYQVDNSQTRVHEGSGLGLALVKEIIELHHGGISVSSKYGKGTTFTITLPTSNEIFRKEEIIENDDHKQHKKAFELQPLTDAAKSQTGSKRSLISPDEHPVLLIVEDNADMRTYVRNILSFHYNVREAVNGREGLEKAQQEVPDLIISDIMMPEMDGYKFCELIKTNELTSHIPVILLTARADRESKITGLETGADDYLLKPFDTDELKLIVRNRIEERRKMRERFSREVKLEPKHIAITSLDERFLKKLLDVIETHMDDERFSIAELSAEAGYSHIQFYRKLKALTGQAPNQFLRTIRLKRAAELLRNNSDHIAQIAYSVGFGSESYFIRCFKDQYGVTPGQFAEKKPTAQE